MRNFTAFKIDPLTHSKIRAASSMVSGDEKLIRFTPPEDNAGLKAQEELFRTLYQYTDHETFFNYVNDSAVCGYEVWLEDREVEFSFYVPNEDLEKHYKRQLNTHYSGCELGPKQGKMISIEEGEYAVAIRFQLDNHYFEPVTTRSSSAYRSNPYKSILGEMSLTEDMSAMIQFMFKPAEPDWTQLHSKNVTEHAEDVVGRHSHESKFFGMKSVEVDPPSEVKTEAGLIRDQRNSRGFYMDIRVVLVGPDKYEVEQQASQLSNLYEELYESPAGQKLVPDGYDNPTKMKDILLDIAQRNPKYMRQPKAPKSFLHHKFSDNEDTLIMSLDELVTLAPIPYKPDFENVEGLKWADKPLEGAVSGVGDTWSPPSEEEESEIKDRLRGSTQSDIDSSVKTPEGAPVREVDPEEDENDNEDNETETTEDNRTKNRDPSQDEKDIDEKLSSDKNKKSSDDEEDENEDNEDEDSRWNEDIDDMLG